MHACLTFWSFLLSKKLSKNIFAKINLARYHCSNNTYIIYVDWISIIVKFLFFHFQYHRISQILYTSSITKLEKSISSSHFSAFWWFYFYSRWTFCLSSPTPQNIVVSILSTSFYFLFFILRHIFLYWFLPYLTSFILFPYQAIVCINLGSFFVKLFCCFHVTVKLF